MSPEEISQFMTEVVTGLEVIREFGSRRLSAEAEIKKLYDEAEVAKAAIRDAEAAAAKTRADAAKAVAEATRNATGQLETAKAEAERIKNEAAAFARASLEKANEKVQLAKNAAQVEESRLASAKKEIAEAVATRDEILKQIENLKQRFV